METPTLTDERIVEMLNKSYERGVNPAVTLLKGKISAHDRSNNRFVMEFQADNQMTNGKAEQAQVQGGISSAMLDAACANAVVFFSRLEATVATLEQKCTFLGVVPPNIPLEAEATMVKQGKVIAFLEARLRVKGTKQVLVSATQTNQLIPIVRKPKNGENEKNNNKPKL